MSIRELFYLILLSFLEKIKYTTRIPQAIVLFKFYLFKQKNLPRDETDFYLNLILLKITSLSVDQEYWW